MFSRMYKAKTDTPLKTPLICYVAPVQDQEPENNQKLALLYGAYI